MFQVEERSCTDLAGSRKQIWECKW